ncbi:tetrapyrrole biosynthesis, uroporphyrinogen III synthase, partial [Periconia macrospinosa]
MAEDSPSTIPILLLKTKSTPADAYEEYFSTFDNNRYTPAFVPVLEHKFKQDALSSLSHHIKDGDFRSTPGASPQRYGAMIFTSQRAVEAFTQVIEDLRRDSTCSLDSFIPESLPLYVVGPATARGLRALNLPCPILGEETGSGEVLAPYILKHYNSLHPGPDKPAVLFLVGEKRRDIIPKTLQSPDLPIEQRSSIHELVIYETGELQSFKDSFTSIWRRHAAKASGRQWVVVFSPQGCRAMLESLGLIDLETGQSKWQSSKTSQREVLIATIGPTTRDYLVQEFDIAPDVCAEKPSPEGVGEGIQSRAKLATNASKEESAAGTKRKADDASPKNERKAAKKQVTIEESINGPDSNDTPVDSELPDVDEKGENHSKEDQEQLNAESNDEKPEVKNDSVNSKDPDNVTKTETDGDDTIQESSQREETLPSNILEKGLIYFFIRNRVNVEEAESVGDLQRTYFVLRPLPLGAKLGEGALPDLQNNRLLALPKKVFPKSHKDRFMAFVEKAPTTIQDLKDNFFPGTEYQTKTSGTRRVEPVTPVAEGVYAITKTEDTSTHLAYAITIPSDIGEVQDDLGLRSQGSFIISVKNPKRSSPANTNLPRGPDFPDEIIEEFRNLAWSKVQPKHLDYPNAQILLIGEKLESAVEPTKRDQKHGKGEPQEELEKLEHEDELRVEHLNGNDSVFDDLHLRKKDFSEVPTTW